MNHHASRFIRLALVVPCLCAAPLAAGAASVAGTVRDAVTLDPVPDVQLTLHVLDPDSVAIAATSGPGGAYAITGAPDGNRLYVLTGGGGPVYAGFYARLPIPDPTLTFDVLLDSLQIAPPGEPYDSSAVFGQILSSPDGMAVPGAAVSLSSGDGAYVVHTGVDGRYALTVPLGTYTAGVTADGYEPVTDAGLEAETGGLSYDAFLVLSTADTPPPGPQGVAGIRSIRPNPSRGSTEIRYVLAVAGRVELAIYDLSGREVSHLVSGWNDTGPQVATFDAARLPAGVYFCRLQAPGTSVSRRVAIMP